jgi:hypothetical protein
VVAPEGVVTVELLGLTPGVGVEVIVAEPDEKLEIEVCKDNIREGAPGVVELVGETVTEDRLVDVAEPDVLSDPEIWGEREVERIEEEVLLGETVPEAVPVLLPTEEVAEAVLETELEVVLETAGQVKL